MIAAAVFTVFLSAAALAMQQSMLGVACTSLEGGMDAKGSDILELMTKELKDSGTKYSNFTIDSTGQSITFARSIGALNNAPVFGNQIRYYAGQDPNGNTFLGRDETVNGSVQTTVMSNQLSPTAIPVTAVKGINGPGFTVNVTGINFTKTSADIVTITLVLQQTNNLLTTNVAGADNTMVIVSQGSVQLMNDL